MLIREGGEADGWLDVVFRSCGSGKKQEMLEMVLRVFLYGVSRIFGMKEKKSAALNAGGMKLLLLERRRYMQKVEFGPIGAASRQGPQKWCLFTGSSSEMQSQKSPKVQDPIGNAKGPDSVSAKHNATQRRAKRRQTMTKMGQASKTRIGCTVCGKQRRPAMDG